MRPRLLLCFLAVSVAVASAGIWRFAATTRAAASVGAIQASAPPIPVTLAVSEVKDVPVYLTGLGTVQAYNTVTVKVRVDGQLTKVAFTEGQNVKEGDLLAQIDP